MTHLQSSKAAQPKASRAAVASNEKCSSVVPHLRPSASQPSSALKTASTTPSDTQLRQNRFNKASNMHAKADRSKNTQKAVLNKRVATNCFDSASKALQTSTQTSKPCEKIDILGMDFDNLTPQEFLTSLRKGVVFTPNVDHMMKLRKDPEFARVYQKADFKICDSQVVMYASRFLGTPLKAKISGSDLFPWFCEHHKENDDIRIFLLGGREGVAKQARDRINARTGREIVVGEYSPPFGFEHSASECDQVVSAIEQSSANVVAVCLGAPKQEKWIAANCDRLPGVDIFMAVGAVVDFEAGAKPRAPRFVSELGLEWLYRLMCEPKRLWRRYLLEDMPFVGLVLAEKFRRITSSRR